MKFRLLDWCFVFVGLAGLILSIQWMLDPYFALKNSQVQASILSKQQDGVVMCYTLGQSHPQEDFDIPDCVEKVMRVYGASIRPSVLQVN